MTEPDVERPRVVAISGAGTGIGQATARKFGEQGWQVVVGGRRVDRLTETASLVDESGGACLAHELDVTDAESVERFFAAAEERFGTVTAVINNAATARYGPLDDFSPAEIEVEIATKLIGALYMARRGIQAMRRDGGGGDILFVTSLAAVQPWPFHLPYAAANAGRRAGGAHAAVGARGHRHPRERPALRRDDRHGLQHARAGERTRRRR